MRKRIELSDLVAVQHSSEPQELLDTLQSWRRKKADAGFAPLKQIFQASPSFKVNEQKKVE